MKKIFMIISLILISSLSQAADFVITVSPSKETLNYSLVCKKLSNQNEEVRLPSIVGPNGLGQGCPKLPSGYLICEPRGNGVVAFYNSSSGAPSNFRTNPVFRYVSNNCTGTPNIAFPAITFNAANSLMRISATITKNGPKYFKIPESSSVIVNQIYGSFISSDGNCVTDTSTVSYSFPAEEIIDSNPDLSDIDVLKCVHEIK